MKIEKISDTQIRCTLTRTDLQTREIKISELAYGTEKAKSLFHDMIDQAARQFGFEAEDLPLMIEAIPVSLDCIILIITKVDDPEELDTRFSKFTASDEEMDDVEFQDDEFLEFDDNYSSGKEEHPEHVLDGPSDRQAMPDNFIPIAEAISKAVTETPVQEEAVEVEKEPEDISKLFSFHSWNEASYAAQSIDKEFKGNSSLYKDSHSGIYFLLLTDKADSDSNFFKVCNVLTEYGKKEKFTYLTYAYLNERCDILVKENAVHILSEY